MSVTTETPASEAEMSPSAARIPTRIGSLARRLIKGRYDLPAVVARHGRFGRWVAAKALRLYYPRSMVSRRNALAEWVAVNVRNDLPTLYHFDIHLTDHCNLNCKGCVHFSNICEPRFVDPEEFAEDLAAMAARVNVEQIYLLGGEPLLHPRVNELMRIARGIFPRTRICLVTNGILLFRMDDGFWRTLAELRIVLICEAYPIELPRQAISAKASEYGVSLEWTSQGGRFYKVPIDLTGSQNPTDSFHRCSGITNCPLYKDGRLYPCAYPAHVDAFAGRFGLDGLEAVESDSISVRDSDGESIMRFMKHPVPFCRHCDFDHFVEYEWDRSSRTIDEWTRGHDESDSPRT